MFTIPIICSLIFICNSLIYLCVCLLFHLFLYIRVYRLSSLTTTVSFNSLLAILALCHRRLRALPHLHPVPGWSTDALQISHWNIQCKRKISTNQMYTFLSMIVFSLVLYLIILMTQFHCTASRLTSTSPCGKAHRGILRPEVNTSQNMGLRFNLCCLFCCRPPTLVSLEAFLSSPSLIKTSLTKPER